MAYAKKRVRKRLDGLKLIAAYLDLSLNETRKLYDVSIPPEDRLPVFPLRPSKAPNNRLSAWVDELDRWQDEREERHLYRTK